ncbi:MAG: XRE family transcriptional regulator [Peptostreptococcaceae bacterium]|nr:XRE family transcriptional regulator [Peptostreptococcaceae bacterium]
MKQSVINGRLISSRLEQKGMTQRELAQIVGVTEVTISRYINGTREPKGTVLKDIADALDIPVASLILPIDAMSYIAEKAGDLYQAALSAPREMLEYIKIPVLGLVKAGLPSEAIEDVLDWEEVPKDWMKGGKEYFALEISGDSMLPRMEEGDVIIVQKQSWCDKSGDVMVVRVNGDEATVKKVLLQENGILLVAYNSEYQPIFYSKKDIKELPVEYIGKVVELRGKF